MSLQPRGLRVVDYILRAISIFAGLVLSLGGLWFLGAAPGTSSAVLELMAGISGIVVGFLPLSTFAKGLGRLIWIVLALLVVANAAMTFYGVGNGMYGVEVLKWMLTNTLAVAALLILAAKSSVRKIAAG
jgi:hypothetical protein